MEHQPSQRKRLRKEEFELVTLENCLEARDLLVEGKQKHPFADSKDYDVLLDDGTCLAPKALFGIAMSIALNTKIHPDQFVGGEKTHCFRVLRKHGFRIVPKSALDEYPISDEEKEWLEGGKERRIHLLSERDRKAVAAKKREFRNSHEGSLACEQCNLDPNDADSQWDESCIEVHHKLPLAEYGRRETTVKDLMCVCANCHRVIHKELSKRHPPEKSL